MLFILSDQLFLLQHLTNLLFTNKIGLSHYYATLSNVPLICIATITGLKIATDIVAKTTKHYGLVATKKMATTLLCADKR